MREMRARLREQQQRNDAIQPVVQANSSNSFVSNIKFIWYWKMWTIDNFHVQFECSNLSLN